MTYKMLANCLTKRLNGRQRCLTRHNAKMRCTRILEKDIIIAILVFYANIKHLENKRIMANLSLYVNSQHRMEKERKLIKDEKLRMADYAYTNKLTAHLPDVHTIGQPAGRRPCQHN